MKPINLVEFSEYEGPDGAVYKFGSGGRAILSEEGFGTPPIAYMSQKGPLQHGETPYDFRLQPRTIQIVLRQDTYNRFDYWTERSNLMSALNPFRVSSFAPGIFRKYFPDGTKREIKAVIQEGPGFVAKDQGYWDEWGYTEALRFICHDPLLYDPDQHSVSWSLGSPTDQLQFPATFPIIFGTDVIDADSNVYYDGTWETFPNFEIEGPLNGIHITNEATGKKIEIEYVISVGETVTIYLEEHGNKKVYNQLGTNLMGAVTTDSNLTSFSLVHDPIAANGLNLINVLAAGATGSTSVTMTYYSRFWGI